MFHKVTVFTDGACKRNGKPDASGGFAAILQSGERQKVVVGNRKQVIEGKKVTNNLMELLAVIAAINALTKPSEVSIYTDSIYILNGYRDRVENNWTTKAGKEIANIELWRYLMNLIEKGGHKVEAYHVKAHSGETLNELADNLASDAAQLLDAGIPSPRNGYWIAYDDNEPLPKMPLPEVA